MNGVNFERESNRLRTFSEKYFPYGNSPFLFGVFSVFDIWGEPPENFDVPIETDARALIAKSWRIAGQFMYDALETHSSETPNE